LNPPLLLLKKISLSRSLSLFFEGLSQKDSLFLLIIKEKKGLNIW
jgi:hypothetical protein